MILMVTWLIPITLACLDQMTKSWVIHNLSPHQLITLCPYIQLTHSLNQGVTLGLFPAHTPLQHYSLITLTLILLGSLLWHYQKLAQSTHIQKMAVILVLLGGTSNLIDRLMYQSVIDYIILHLNSWYWPGIFNIADVSITVGSILYILTSSRSPRTIPTRITPSDSHQTSS